MDIDWASLGKVSIATVVAAFVVVVTYAIGVALLSRVEESVASGGTAARVASATTMAQRGLAYVCFAVSAVVVLYGLYVIIPQFH